MPVALSFTLETDGKLPTGDRLADAIEIVDAATGSLPGLLHDQLRAPDALREHVARRRRVVKAAARHPRQRVEAEPRRTQ